MRAALITGIAGQDGSYLPELLLGKGYRVVGTVSEDTPADMGLIRYLFDRIEVVQDDLLDQERVGKVFHDY